MKLYAIAMIAVKENEATYSPRCLAHFVFADDKESAKIGGLKLCLDAFHVADGWELHDCSVRELELTLKVE